VVERRWSEGLHRPGGSGQGTALAAGYPWRYWRDVQRGRWRMVSSINASPRLSSIQARGMGEKPLAAVDDAVPDGRRFVPCGDGAGTALSCRSARRQRLSTGPPVLGKNDRGNASRTGFLFPLRPS